MAFVTTTDLIPLIPELILLGAAFVVLLLDLFAPGSQRTTLAVTTIVGFVIALVAEIQLLDSGATGFYGTIVADGFSILFESLYLVIGILTVLLSLHYLDDHGIGFGEYYVLLITAVVGMMFIAAALARLRSECTLSSICWSPV